MYKQRSGVGDAACGDGSSGGTAAATAAAAAVAVAAATGTAASTVVCALARVTRGSQYVRMAECA